MGGTTYSSINRSTRAVASGYHTKSRSDIFGQTKKGMVHESMDSKGINLREARDSEAHPNTIPVILALDVTGSMGDIPHDLVKDGLPTIMQGLIDAGLPDVALLFLGIGDHETDGYPLQIGQFESGDKELDLWLTRTYLEGGGGANAGESYGLTHYVASRICKTDAWDKRKKKGILITIGDEPNLTYYPEPALREISGEAIGKGFSDVEILAEAEERWDVFHIHPTRHIRGNRRDSCEAYWGQLLGERYIQADTNELIVEAVKDIVLKQAQVEPQDKDTTQDTQDIL